jgi:hypothetical protein
MTQVSERVDPLLGTLHGVSREVTVVPNHAGLATYGLLAAQVPSESPPVVEVELPSPRWLMAMVDEINVAALLPQDWDSYGGARLIVKAAVRAIELLDRLDFTGPSPWVSPSPDGGLHVEWDRGSLSVQLDVDEAGDVDVLVEEGDSTREWTSNAFGDPELREILRRVSNG